MNAIQEMLKEIKQLKPMPQVAIQIMKIVEDPKSSIGDVAELVMYDPALTANILKMCNSVFFGLPRKVDSVHEAISMMGLDQIVDLVLLKGGADNLLKGQDGYGLHEGELWRHAVSSAIIAKDLAGKKESKNKHLIFTAALLKDIGKVILDRYISESMIKIAGLVQSGNYSFGEAEKKVIGISHAELGGIVAKMWGFSPKMIFMITNHHLTDKSAGNDPDTSIIYLADIVCMMMGIGGGSDGLAYRFHKDVLDHMKINSTDLQEIIAGFGEKMKKVDDLMGSV
jgi:putative nucleotidyltransferase with HDIG domain